MIILKIGGSVITKKTSPLCAREAEIHRISQEIASFLSEDADSLILVHGAGSFGHPQAMKYRFKEDAEGVYLIHKAVKTLNSMVVESLNKEGVRALPVHPLSSCILENSNIIDFQLENIRIMLELGIVPVLHGDVVMDKSKGIEILSGDRIISYLADTMSASKIGAGSDVDGVLDNRGELIKKITPLSFVDIKKHIYSTRDATHGMLGKVNEFVELAKKGIDSRIFNASRKGMVSKFLYGEDVGTLIANK